MRQKDSAKLIFFCGKMAAGKSTLARDLAVREDAVLLVQDDFLNALFPGEITDIPGFVKCSVRLKNALTPHVCALLSKGISVALDFPGNTKVQRAWFRELIERANVEHELHFVDTSDALCKSQLRERSTGLPAGSPGPESPTLKPSLRIFSHRRRRKTLMSSIMSGFSISGTQSNRLDFSDYPTNVCHEQEKRKR
jgi:predicted kinase